MAHLAARLAVGVPRVSHHDDAPGLADVGVEGAAVTLRESLHLECRACGQETVLPREGGPFEPCCGAVQKAGGRALTGRALSDVFNVSWRACGT